MPGTTLDTLRREMELRDAQLDAFEESPVRAH